MKPGLKTALFLLGLLIAAVAYLPIPVLDGADEALYVMAGALGVSPVILAAFRAGKPPTNTLALLFAGGLLFATPGCSFFAPIKDDVLNCVPSPPELTQELTVILARDQSFKLSKASLADVKALALRKGTEAVSCALAVIIERFRGFVAASGDTGPDSVVLDIADRAEEALKELGAKPVGARLAEPSR